MTILWTIIVGAVIGALARLVMPGRQPVGVIVTILLGIVGAFLGSWLTAQFGYQNSNGGQIGERQQHVVGCDVRQAERPNPRGVDHPAAVR